MFEDDDIKKDNSEDFREENVNSSASNSEDYRETSAQDNTNTQNYSSSESYTGSESYSRSQSNAGSQSSDSNSEPYRPNSGSYYSNQRSYYDNGAVPHGDGPKKKNNKKFATIAGVSVLCLAVVIAGVFGVTSVFGKSSSSSSSQSASTTTTASAETATTTHSSTSTSGSGSVSTVQTGTVTAVSTDVSAVVEEVAPSVVAITNTTVYQNYNNGSYNPWSYFYGNGSDSSSSNSYETTGSGSGVIIAQTDELIYIVTNNHVIEDATYLTVTFIDETSVDATLRNADETNDLALVTVKVSDLSSDTLSKIKIAVFGDSDSLKMGQGVIAIGNALGLGQSTTYGIISALGRSVTFSDGYTRTLLQTDAAINPGNSGGALFNNVGELIGINSAKYSDESVEGIGYAIPINTASEIIDEMLSTTPRTKVTDTDKQSYIGIMGRDISSTYASYYNVPQGVYVSSLTTNSPAANSGLTVGDIITALNGKKITSMSDLQNELLYYEGGTTVTLTVSRTNNNQYTSMDITVTLGYAKDAQTTTNSRN